MSLSDTVIRLVHEATRPMRSRLNAVVARLVVDAVNDAAARQLLRVEVLADEVIDPVEHFQPGGLTHVPLAGAEGLLLCVGGDRSHPIAVGVSNRDKRPTGLAAGETGLYSAVPSYGGLKIKLDADGNVVLTPTGKVTIDGNLEVSGEVTAKSASPATKVTLSHHAHASFGAPPATPEPP